VSKISIKNDLVLNYIESLADGTRVSVRELSATLQVSEGTAYKAVKEAEQRGLVVVKPKAGTVRIVRQRSPCPSCSPLI
jgi:predicted transcriptional regulator